ncbi:tetratricopeptide repeat protein [Capsulimonas corticalis]|uniref:tetratricopeptide repeat protein n=1 Tax=Capsulimonas corticalis TaxID=2219043 RepID=UPI00261DFF02|nr:tetratricopeptide repeat protein [Capsulimonas corticalis]
MLRGELDRPKPISPLPKFDIVVMVVERTNAPPEIFDLIWLTFAITNTFPWEPANKIEVTLREMLIPHAAQILRHIEALTNLSPKEFPLERALRLARFTAKDLRDAKNYRASLACYQQAVRIHAAMPRPNTNQMSLDYALISILRAALDEYEAALEPAEVSVRLRISSDAGHANHLKQLAKVQHKLGRLAEARVTYKQAIELYRTQENAAFAETAPLLGLMKVVIALGDWESVDGTLARILELCAGDLQPADADKILTNLIGLITPNYPQTPKSPADEEKVRILTPHAITTLDMLGSRTDINPAQATVLAFSLAKRLAHVNRGQEAIRFYRQSIAIREAVQGPSTVDGATIYNLLAILLLQLKDRPAAQAAAERAVEIDRSRQEEKPERLARLGSIYRSLGRLEEARASVEHALELAGPTPADPTQAALHLCLLSEIQIRLEDREQADLTLTRAIDFYESANQPDHPQSQAVARDIATLKANLRA